MKFRNAFLFFDSDKFCLELGRDSLLIGLLPFDFVNAVRQPHSLAHHGGSQELAAVGTDFAFEIGDGGKEGDHAVADLDYGVLLVVYALLVHARGDQEQTAIVPIFEFGLSFFFIIILFDLHFQRSVGFLPPDHSPQRTTTLFDTILL